MKEWCLGFIVNRDPDEVVLLRKSKTMHVGMWNGLGGKLEPLEPALAAMIRECKEEANLDIPEWDLVGYLRGTNNGEPWRVFVYVAPLTTRIDEITSDWATKASMDIPFRINIENLGYMVLAPHTEVLVHASLAKLRKPTTPIIQIMEVA